MPSLLKQILTVQSHFLEELLIKLSYIFVIIFAIGTSFAVMDLYVTFNNILPKLLIFFPLLFAIVFLLVNLKKIFTPKYIVDYCVIIFILLFCIFNAFHFSEIKIEGGHDQGTYLEGGISLAKSGSLVVDSVQRPFVSTFPGWTFAKENGLRHHFVPGNVIFIAIFYKLLGITGIKIANSFLLFFSASILYFLCKKIKGWKTGLIFILLFLFNYYTIYFSRAHYVENVQLFITWLYIYFMIDSYQKHNITNAFLAIIPLSFLLFVRLEAPFYMLMYFLYVTYCLVISKRYPDKNQAIIPAVVSIFTGLFLIYMYYVYLGGKFLGPDAISSIQSLFTHLGSGGLAWEKPPYNEQVFLFMYLLYAFGPIFLITLLLSVYSLLKDDKRIKKEIFLIFLLIIPQFAFLYRPEVALYLPWAMRRYWAVFIPFTFILISLSITNMQTIFSNSKKIQLFIISVLCFMFTLPSLSIIGLSQGKGILSYLKEVATKFTDEDLVVFIDRYQYENWAPPLYFLYDTHVVYERPPSAMRPYIYAKLIKTYKNIYIATSLSEEQLRGTSLLGKKITFVETIASPTFKILDAPTGGGYCGVTQFIVSPKLFKGYYQFNELCSQNNPSTKVNDYNINLNIYKVEDHYKNEFINTYYDPNFILNETPWNKTYL